MTTKLYAGYPRDYWIQKANESAKANGIKILWEMYDELSFLPMPYVDKFNDTKWMLPKYPWEKKSQQVKYPVIDLPLSKCDSPDLLGFPKVGKNND